MNMQPALHSRSSSNGFGRRRGDRDMGTRPDNRSQPGKSNASSRLPNTGNKSGVHGSPSRDRLVYVSTCLIGQHVEVQVKSGAVYSGIFHATSAENDYGIVLKMARMTKGGLKSSADSVTKAPTKTLIIHSKELVQVIAKDVPVTRDGFSAEVQSEKHHDMMTDSNISQPRYGEMERELERWVPDKDDLHRPELEHVFDSTWNRGWNQFEANETLFGVKSTFNEEIYTTKLDRGPQMREREREAQRIAREIEGEETRDLHLAEERGLQLIGKYDVDEETRFSSVIRGKIVDDSEYEENEDALLDSCNDETFGDFSTSPITSSTDWTKGKSNDAVQASTTSRDVEQAQSSQSNVSANIGRSDSYDHTRQLSSEAPLKSSSTSVIESSSRRQENQLGENVGISEIDESSEKHIVNEEIPLSKSDDSSSSSSLTGKKDVPEKEAPPNASSSASSHVSAKANEKLNSAGESVESPVTGKPLGQTQAMNSHGRPGSSASSRSEYVAGPSTSGGPGLSPSSSVGSLASEKSSLNPYAKEFKLNPNAKSFVPSPIRSPSPVAEGSFYYPPNMPAVPQIPGMPIGMAQPPFGQQVVFNPPPGPPQPYFPPNGPPPYGQQMYVPSRFVYMQGYHQPETQYRGRDF